MLYFKNLQPHSNFIELLDVAAPTNYFKSTYRDKECTTLQYPEGRRTFKSLYNIVTTYYPDTTLKELATYLLKQYHTTTGDLPIILPFFCSNIEEVVFRKYPRKSASTPIREDELDAKTKPYNYTFNEIKALADEL